jgi:hypothetical protein
MSRTVRTRWANDPEPPEAPGAEWESFLAQDMPDRGCHAKCGTCGKPQARAERRQERHGKRNSIREQMES